MNVNRGLEMDEIDKDLLGFYWDYFEGEKVRNVKEENDEM